MVFVWLVLFVSLATYVYIVVKKKQNYWKEEGVPFIKPKFYVGSLEIFRSKSFAEHILDFYRAFPEERYHGMYQFMIPVLVIKDPDLIKQITIKEFDHFHNHRAVVNDDLDPFWSKNLFASRDEKWRRMRSTLSPSFTASKMKIMFGLIEECAREFVDYFNKESGDLIELEMKDALSRYTNDVIASTAFGLKCNSLKDRKNEFYQMGKDASNFGGLRILKFFVYEMSPILFELLRIKIIPPKITDYFSKIIEETVKTRKNKNIIRPDMIQLLMEAQEDKKELTIDKISSQAFIFFLAGFETVSTFLTFTFYELALNPEIQDRLRQEIQKIDEKITYESLLSLKYLDMVVSESLRKWPPNVVTDRQVSKDFIIEPVKQNEKPVLLRKDQICWVPIFGIHRDEKYYPDPEKFDPERFGDGNKINPSVYLPFGAGPRNCIGSRFALLESKLILCYILKNFQVVPVAKTHVPVVLDKSQINLTPHRGMWLGLKKIKSSL